MPSTYGTLTETVGCCLVGPTPCTPTRFGYADGRSGTPTGAVGVSSGRNLSWQLRRQLYIAWYIQRLSCYLSFQSLDFVSPVPACVVATKRARPKIDRIRSDRPASKAKRSEAKLQTRHLDGTPVSSGPVYSTLL